MICVNFSNRMINNPVAFVHKPAFFKAKLKLFKHGTIHFFLHNTYCRLSPHWRSVIYTVFLEVEGYEPDVTQA